jgi:hypothetical protein
MDTLINHEVTSIARAAARFRRGLPRCPAVQAWMVEAFPGAHAMMNGASGAPVPTSRGRIDRCSGDQRGLFSHPDRAGGIECESSLSHATARIMSSRRPVAGRHRSFQQRLRGLAAGLWVIYRVRTNVESIKCQVL